jgi:NMD protein affecting ribosome stability and mRNA decay
VACINCHTTGYAGTSTLCVSCHQLDYNTSKNPDHLAAQFSTDCKSCHGTAAWIPSAFNHTTSTTFPLTGSHIGLSCISCHTKGYPGTSTDCASCHIATYNSTKNPVHTSAQFSTSCEFCHTSTAWVPSTYNHDAMFLISSGKHKKGEAWNLCTECHTNPSNYAAFACILCHVHSNQADLNDKHKDYAGYTYTSAACLSCHPRGLRK